MPSACEHIALIAPLKVSGVTKSYVAQRIESKPLYILDLGNQIKIKASGRSVINRRSSVGLAVKKTNQ